MGPRADVPVLTGVAPIVRIATADELLDAVAHAVEEIDSADELERILDGISRLCGERPADFERRAAPLAHRLVATTEVAGRGPTNSALATLPLRNLLHVWLTGQPALPTYRGSHAGHAIHQFIEERLIEIYLRAAKRTASSNAGGSDS